MIPLTVYKGKKVGVFGLGKSGEATVKALIAGGAKVYAWDDAEVNIGMCREGNPEAHYLSYDRWPWDEIETMVMSPGVPLHYPQPHLAVTVATMKRSRIVGDIELLQEQCPEASYVGITGTNGKSTTTALTGHILKQAGRKVQVGGNLGTPALALEPLGKDGVYVLEVSSYQLDLLSATIFNVAALLNISPDHIDRHGSMEGYVAAKRAIFNGQQEKDTAIVGLDDEHCKAIFDEMKSGKHRYAWQGKGAKLVGVSTKRDMKNEIFAKAGILHDGADGPTIDISAVPTLQGQHNWQNAAFAGAICKALDVSKREIEAGFKSFAGLEHRMQIINAGKSPLCINDSKATNADAAARSLATYDHIYWIVGGKPKEGGIDSLEEYFPKVRKAYLIGEAAKAFAELLKAKGVDHVMSHTLENATKAALKDARKDSDGGVVLLAPACASFDQFPSFEARGKAFAELVNQEMNSGGQPSDASKALTA